jgi:acid phosphatase type 7
MNLSMRRSVFLRWLIGALMVMSLAVPVVAAAAPSRLLLSTRADRSAALELEGSTASGNIYVFVPDDPAITRVRFWLDNPQMSGGPTKNETNAPWDFAGTNKQNGTAYPYSTTQLSDGQHSISAKVTLASGTIESISSSFTVSNGGGSDGLSFSPDSLNFSVQQGGTTSSKTTSLQTISGAPAAFTLTETSPWLQVTPSTGTTSSVVTAAIDATGLAPGTYSATVTASSSGLTNAQLAVSLQVTEAPGTRALMVSKQANRSSPVALAGSTQSDNIFVFVPNDPAITRVRFWLDNPQMSGTPTKTENGAPWDFAGTNTGNGLANAYDTTKISNGSHTIAAAIDLSGGGTEALNAAFTVSNTFDRAPDQIHLAWVQEPSTTLTFVWHTTHTSTPSEVRYRKTGQTSWTLATGALRPSGTLGTLHEATVTGLSPSTEYEYQLRGDGTAWSPTLSTRTAPPPGPASFDAVYFADTGLIGRNDGLATGTEQVIQEIAALDPLFVLPGGDYAYFDTDKRFGSLNNTIDAWFKQMAPVASRAPMMPTYGNHEALLGEGFEPWSARFPTPDGLDDRRNYSFDVGDAHFVSIFAVQGFQGLSSAQLSWIEQDILAAKSRGQRWIIPYYHVSPFADGTIHPSNTQLRAQLGPLFEQLGVQIAVSSHDQAYERSYPLKNVPSSNTPTSTSLSCYTLDDGVTWVKVSPSGKLSNKNGDFSPFATDPPPSWTAYRDNTMHHIARIHVDATGYLRFDTYGVVGDGTAPVLLDSFEYRDGEC